MNHSFLQEKSCFLLVKVTMKSKMATSCGFKKDPLVQFSPQIANAERGFNRPLAMPMTLTVVSRQWDVGGLQRNQDAALCGPARNN